MKSNTVNVIGAGLAGCEAAWQLAKRGINVKLYDMKPAKRTPAHKTDYFAELVCSNSLRAARVSSGPGLLKEEMRRLGSLIIKCADENQVPAGGALAVDRDKFSKAVTDAVLNHERIEYISEECKTLPDGYTIIATGPLTSEALSSYISGMLGEKHYYFYDAAAPIVTRDSLDFSKIFQASRYDKGSDYLNCPMTREEYRTFWEALVNAETAPLELDEEEKVFEGCMPVETMAKRGEQALTFGPLKPVGLTGADGRRPYAVVQLRQDNAEGTLYNIVGFQTHLKFGEQKRVFSMIPGLENAEFVRYGVMHRNTYIDSPRLLDSNYRLRKDNKIMFAGQITGVEGYIESAASGLHAGMVMAYSLKDRELPEFPAATAIGALSKYISREGIENFQPTNINFGIIEGLQFDNKIKKIEKYDRIAENALKIIDRIVEEDESFV